MKIAHVTSGVRGLATYSLNLYNYFEKQEDVETLIITSSKWKKQPIPIYEADSYLIGNVLPWPKDVKEVEKQLIDFNPDILHHHHPSGRLDFDAGKFQKKLDVPMICTVHMSVGSKKYMVDKVMHSFFMTVRKNFKNVNAYVAISKYVQNQLIEMGGVPKERIVLLYAGVDPQIFTPIPREKHDTLEISFVGQIMHEKGIDLLIDVVSDLAKEKKVRLNIIGEGNLKTLLQTKTKNNPAINWVGYLNSQDKVAEFYAKSDVVVLPNRWDEAFSYIPLESMSSGTAIIASRVGGNTEAIIDGKTGLLFDVNNGDELYALLKNTETEAFWEMGQYGREHVLENFTLDRFGKKYHALYHNLMTNPSKINQID
jgi:glycosyltransferase involved in cell wall biosynthesis